jgi:hypothetical protein
MPIIDNIFENNSDYFGFKFNKDNELKFLLPKFILPSEELNHFESFKLLKIYSGVVKKYQSQNKNSEDISNNYDFFMNNNKIYGYISLILDYFENSNFILFEQFYSKGNKKINWQKTLENQDIIIQNNKIIYNSFISKNKKRTNTDEFYRVYLYTFSLAWNIFFNQNFFDNEISINYSINKIKAIINQFIDEHFRDREIEIAHILKSIYDSLDVSISGNSAFQTEYCTEIQDIWETVVDSVIPNDIKKNQEQVKGKYLRVRDKFEIKGLSTEIDHCLKLEKTKRIFILDSKFYSTYHNFNSKKQPKSESINKQETYKRIMELENKDYKVSNFFIFPKNNLKYKNPEYFCDHILQRKKIDDNFLIHCVALDFSKTCELFIKNSTYKDFIQLFIEYKIFFNLFSKEFTPEMFINLFVYEKIKENQLYTSNELSKILVKFYVNLEKYNLNKVQLSLSSKLTLKTKSIREIFHKFGWNFKIVKKDSANYYQFFKI